MLASLVLSVWKLITDGSSPFAAGCDAVNGEEAPVVPSLSDADPMSTYWESYEAMRPVYSKNFG